VALLSSVATTAAFAADAPAPEVSPIAANVTVASSYVYRGLTQTNNKPAIQGGFDYAHESGFYVGNWNSNISWISDQYGGGAINGVNFAGSGTGAVTAPIEMDFYAGFKKELIGEGFASDFGVLQYYYPVSGMVKNAPTAAQLLLLPANRQSSGASPSTTEVYAAQNFTAGPVVGFVKFSYAVTNLFGIADSKGAFYPDFTANYDTGIAGVTLNAHVGYQYVPRNIVATAAGAGAANAGTWNLSYTDWKFGLTKDFGGGLSGSAYYTGTSVGKVGTTYVYSTPNGGNQGRATGVVALTKTF
jgi:uncharacterized protein (TIGR02001 family)